MQFWILGPIEARRGGRAVTLGTTKHRALLALLLLHPNEVVSSDRLIDELWSEPPETASNALQVYIGKLRKALEPERASGAPGEILVTRAPGYMLRVEPEELDAERFERLVAAGRRQQQAGNDAAAAETLREALGLWRGPALADFTYEPFAQAEIVRLEELRVAALESRLAADLAVGRHADLIGELEALVREHPLRDRLRAQFMLALYRSGRQAEALEAYRDTRQTLVEELGIDPSPELQRLERAILNQDPALELGQEATAGMAFPAEPALRPESEPAGEERRKTVTVLVAQQAGVGTDPEALRDRSQSLLRTLARTAERYEGEVQGSLGDEGMAVFGVPIAHEDDALRAARAAIDLRDGVRGQTEGVRPDGSSLQIGIATGEVLVEVGERGDPVIVGAPATFARRLAGEADPGEILLSEETGRLVGASVRGQAVDRRTGPARRLLGLEPEAAPARPSLETPLVGRGDELGWLGRAFERVERERAIHLITILGPAGIGKSRLAREFASVLSQQATVLTGRCLPYGEGITFWPLSEIARKLSSAGPSLDAADPSAEPIAARFREAVDSSETSASREEIFSTTRELLETLGRGQSVVVFFEDLHWAELTFLELIEYVVERARGASILLVCLARSELLERRPGWGAERPNASSIVLEPLEEAESEELMNNLAVSLPEATRARAREAAGGNPLFLEQILVALAEDEPSDGEVPIPPTIEALLASRLDRLGPGERAVIERAAVIGKEFSTPAVVDLLPDEARPFAERHLLSLVGKELIGPERWLPWAEGGFRFRHILIQQAAYRAIPKRLRARFHERLAEWLEEGERSGTREHSELVGYHLEQAFRYRAELGTVSEAERELAVRAAEHLGSAGHLAFLRGDMPASTNLLERSIRLLSFDRGRALYHLPDLAYALFEIGELERAEGVLAEAREAARASGERAVEWRATVQLGHLRMYLHPEQIDPEVLTAEAEKAIDVLRELDDDAGLARAWIFLSELGWMVGRLADAAEAADHAAEHARRAGSRREEAGAYGTRAFCLLQGPTPVGEIVEWLNGVLEQAEGDPVIDANMSPFLAVPEAMLGRFEDARARIVRGRALTRDLGLRWQTTKHALLGVEVELLAGDPASAERELRGARDAFAEVGDNWCLATLAVALPAIVHAQGRDDAFAAEVDAIDEAPSAPGDIEWQVGCPSVRAKLLARQGDTEAAEALAREAATLAAGSDVIGLQANALIDLSRILDSRGKDEEAAAAAAEAIRLHERKGNAVGAESARAFAARFDRSAAISR